MLARSRLASLNAVGDGPRRSSDETVKYPSYALPSSVKLNSKKKDLRRMYGDLAHLWPIISPPDHYVEEAKLFGKLIEKYAQIKVETLLHLGCGAGHIDRTLKRNFQITGVDISKDMLALAKRLNPEIDYHRGDMRTVRLRREFDAVVIADSIAYMLSEKDLRMAFKTAWIHLRPGGVFCTYAEYTKELFKQNKVESLRQARGDLDVTLIENDFDPDPADTTFDLIFVYLIRRNGNLKIETDHHIAGLFGIETWLRLLIGVGFTVNRKKYPKEEFPILICVKSQVD